MRRRRGRSSGRIRPGSRPAPAAGRSTRSAPGGRVWGFEACFPSWIGLLSAKLRKKAGSAIGAGPVSRVWPSVPFGLLSLLFSSENDRYPFGCGSPACQRLRGGVRRTAASGSLIRLRAIRQAPSTAASAPLGWVMIGTFWLISLSEYFRTASSMGCRK